MAGSLARDLGAQAEARAAWRLRLTGWRIVARNWVGGGGELDLVAARWKTLLIVEVRRRASTDAAVQSVDRAKLDRTLNAAAAYVAAYKLQRYRLRVDVIGSDASGRMRWSKDVLG